MEPSVFDLRPLLEALPPAVAHLPAPPVPAANTLMRQDGHADPRSIYIFTRKSKNAIMKPKTAFTYLFAYSFFGESVPPLAGGEPVAVVEGLPEDLLVVEEVAPGHAHRTQIEHRMDVEEAPDEDQHLRREHEEACRHARPTARQR